MENIQVKRLLTEKEACAYVGAGRSFLRTWGAAIGARVQLGQRSIRYDRSVIDSAIEKQHKNKTE